MRKLTLITLLALLCSAGYGEYAFDDLLDAIAIVESSNNPNAIGDSGEAIGMYQIHKIYVRDTNRIIGEDRYSYDDRWCPVESREMVATYLFHYGGTIEEMARKHNGGPQGHKKESTKKYWLKIRKVLEQSNG